MTPLLLTMLVVPVAVNPSLAAGERLVNAPLPPSLDGRLAFAFLVARAEAPATEGLVVSIRLEAQPSSAQLSSVERGGCTLDRLPSGRVASVGPVVSGWCRWEALWSLAAYPWVKRVEPLDGVFALPSAPVSTTAREVEATQLREGAPRARGGAGIVIADIDSGFDPFHPFLFRADGGAFEWLDVNANGQFDPGIDCVDFNRNGAVDPGETLLVLKAPIANLLSGAAFNTAPAFAAGLDWLFQDENGDGQRNQGADPPYGDGKDTFGEQLYLADDVDENGTLDLGERVLRLKTPKVKAALGWAAGDAWNTAPSVTYRRGVNLSKLLSTYPVPGLADHGTLIAGTLVGGTPALTRYAGLVPDAELIVASWNNTNQVSALAWAKSEGAHIVNGELAKYVNEFLDGSSNLELACDEASAGGVLQVAAAGNLGSQKKHREALHQRGSRTVPLTIPPGRARLTTFSFVWRGAPSEQLSFEVEFNGTTVELQPANGTAQVGNDMVAWGTATSTRGTQLKSIRLWAPAGQTLTGQTVKVIVTNDGPPVEVHGYVSDNYSGWGAGVFWAADASDRSTLCSPATSDKTVAVSSYRLDAPEEGSSPGALAAFSSRGPRVDGRKAIDVTAPEDHISSFRLPNGAFAQMAIGSGTSNAAPMVTAVAALLKALDPAASPDSIRAGLRAHAASDAHTGAVPNDVWGAGKLRGYQAAKLGLAVVSVPPTARGTVVRLKGRLELDASASTDPESDPVTFRWDLDYDGEFDEGPLPSPQLTTQRAAAPWVKLEVTDSHGRSGRALIRVVDGVEATRLPDVLGPSAAGCTGAPSPPMWCLGTLVVMAIGASRRRRLTAEKLQGPATRAVEPWRDEGVATPTSR
jgi:hypothetical protein